MSKMFPKFLVDEEAWDMFVTGPAGTGKTTQLAEDVKYCIDNEIPYIVCAYTHKACGILAEKLPPGANIKTLHSFLSKRPGINSNAMKKEHVNVNMKTGATDEEPKVLFLDEYSMVGEQDFLDIRTAQDGDYDGKPNLKVVWLGDNHQLPPVGDIAAVVPSGDYDLRLTKIYRNDNPLQIPLTKLIGMLEGNDPEALEAVPGFFERDKDIVTEYLADDADKVILAFTNKAVQNLNIDIQGYTEPEPGDTLYSPTTNTTYTFLDWVDHPEYIDIHHSGDPLHLGSKFQTLEWLIKEDLCRFAELQEPDGVIVQFAVTFGHYRHKVMIEELTQIAVDSNKEIERKHPGFKPAGWAKANYKNPLARARAKAWRSCISYKDCVVCLDFAHATTVHKSQGSTYQHVYIDTDDLYIAAQRDFNMYIKLMYVAISRASTKVVTV